MKKMQLKDKKISKFKRIFFCLTISLPALSLFALTSCSNSNAFYIANFQSYMNPALIKDISSQYNNVNFRYFSTNEDLERQFENYYDMAIPSAYLMAKQAQMGLLEKIDWSLFNITYNSKFISNSTEALQLFTIPTQEVLTKVYDITGDGIPDNLLDYGVPYFIQDFILGYKGDKINFSSANPTWADIMTYFSGKVGTNNTYNRIGLIDDFRSIYSIPRVMETALTGSPNVNPPQNNISIAEFQNTYKLLTDYFHPNAFLLNSDSGFILNDFANPKGSDVGIMYNGDLLYSVQGGDEGYSFDPTKVDLVKPQNTLVVLDLMVINKKTKNKSLAYDLLKKITLEGIGNGQDIKTKQNDSYVYGPMLNFSYVQYTSPLKEIDDFVLNGSFFQDNLTDITLEPLCKKIYRINENPSIQNMFEVNISDLQKSNMNYAYTFQKGFF